MTNIKRKSEFEKVVNEDQLEAGILRNPDGSESDELEIPHGNAKMGAKFASPAVGVPSRGQLLQDMEVDEGIFNIDAKAYERESTAPCVASPVVMTDELESKIVSAGMIQTALDSPQAMNAAKIPIHNRKELAERLAEARKDLPTPDSITYIDNRRVIMPAEVRDVPNALPKNLSMKVLEIIIGTELCLKVVKCARQAGVCFFQKPCLWLAQRLSAELSKRRIWEKIEVTGDYDEKDDGNSDSDICKAIGQLFSYHVLEQMQVICATRQISMLQCAQILINRVCDIAIEEKAPKDFTEKYDDINSLEVAVARLSQSA